MVWRTNVLGLCDYVNQTWSDFRGRGMRPTAAARAGSRGSTPTTARRCLARYREAFERREPCEMTYRLLREDGQYRWVSDRGTPYFDPQGSVPRLSRHVHGHHRRRRS